jgi:isopenicillin N synthase-like dioxygenase
MSIATTTTTSIAIPVIDIGAMGCGDAEKAAVAREIRAACTASGFFYVTGHGLSPALFEQLFKQSRAFFALPLEQKDALAMSKWNCNRGYEPLRAQRLEAGAPPDLKEGFQIGFELPAGHPALSLDRTNHGPNQWPSNMSEFKRVLETYRDQMLRVSRLLMRCLARSLDLEEHYFESFSDAPIATLRLLHYPPQPPNPVPNEKGCGAHTDWGAITLLLQDYSGGLEVQAPDGTWIAASPMPGTLVVNIGDLFARWTNNLYHSTMHRVINRSGRDRYSVPFFFDGPSDYSVSCLPTCLKAGEPPLFPQITVKGHLDEMMRLTYGST